MRHSRGTPVPTRRIEVFPGIVDADPVGPLWRGAQLFRMVSYCYALGFHIAINSDLLRSGIAWALFVVLTATTVACGVGYYRGFARNRYWVAGEITVVVALMLSTMWVADDQWARAIQRQKRRRPAATAGYQRGCTSACEGKEGGAQAGRGG